MKFEQDQQDLGFCAPASAGVLFSKGNILSIFQLGADTIGNFWLSGFVCDKCAVEWANRFDLNLAEALTKDYTEKYLERTATLVWVRQANLNALSQAKADDFCEHLFK